MWNCTSSQQQAEVGRGSTTSAHEHESAVPRCSSMEGHISKQIQSWNLPLSPSGTWEGLSWSAALPWLNEGGTSGEGQECFCSRELLTWANGSVLDSKSDILVRLLIDHKTPVQAPGGTPVRTGVHGVGNPVKRNSRRRSSASFCDNVQWSFFLF